ncbi:hypothetical protein GCM10007938_18440 [Vibrio zhanjiangensis]|uniref:DNA gyrase subunit B n=1 Tax=Vibrio zhanjiangensis TaxID=1046128 RepID=A0ABQ6EYE6_9VIBR|nr:hypothetical protein [Vibrio zhanjiangensis]GLT18066.1 hypothetical protein GCM10007938_18440 [Vibrio zhanjiangensis]
MRQVLTVVSAIVLFVYPFAVYFGIDQFGLNLVGVILVVALLLRMFTASKTPFKELKFLSFTTGIVGILLAISGVVFEQHGWLKFYPVLVNLCMLGLFSLSLTQPQSIIERLARLSDPDLPQSGIIYTRKLTAVWCGFFILNASVALYTCFQPIEIWAFYNGFISYIAAGSLFAGEWVMRQILRKED